MRRAFLLLMNKSIPNKFESTLNLPNSRFPMRANAVQNEPVLAEVCRDLLYKEQKAQRASSPLFVLHDGPPYANGEPHVGHAINKVLKDMICRTELLRGKRVEYVPGWDCHGLPIELKAVKEMPKNEPFTPQSIGKVAMACATREIGVQMQAFKSWGVMGDWDKRYETMNPEYEMSQLRAFREMVSNGKIHRGVKPVWWSPATQTALAEAELEYEEKHVSQSVHVVFPIVSTGVANLQGCALVAWTTTPWTLPANRALVVSSELKYCIVKSVSGQRLVVASDLLAKFTQAVPCQEGVEAEFSGVDLVGASCAHPFVEGQLSPVLAGDFVTTEVGTGVVHAAPGHGQDDYLVCGQHGIGPFSPVDGNGRFTNEVGVAGLEGLEVLKEGTRRVIEMLVKSGRVIAEAKYVHKYPYDWRSKTPVIVRSTPQWFLNSQELKSLAEEALKSVRFIPETGRSKMIKTVSARMEDWCISRQRFWGVPIPAFYHRTSGEVLMNEATIDAFLARMVATKSGTSCWWSSHEKDLLPVGYKSEDWVKGTDTMDVWMDSGLSWAHLQDRNQANVPVDLVLEGTDQYRGWFQSLLLTWLATGRKGAPFRCVVVHGFCLDSNGIKMSKSVGNVIPPSAITHGVKSLLGEPKGFEANGVDVMRMWIASHDYSRDVAVSRIAVDAIAKHYRKIRTTVRWLLGVLEDYNPEEQLKRSGYLAQHLLWYVSTSEQEVKKDLENYHFAGVVQRVAEFISELSSIHVESMKDSLYCNARDDGLRRANQHALFAALRFLICSLSPVLPHTVVDIKQCSPQQLKLQLLPQWQEPSTVAECPLSWQQMNALRNSTNRLLEGARNDKLIGSPLDATVNVELAANSALSRVFSDLGEELPCFFGAVSQVTVNSNLAEPRQHSEEVTLPASGEKATVSVAPIGLNKCPRCWLRGNFELLCPRCTSTVSK